jgi:hypothetical protein
MKTVKNHKFRGKQFTIDIDANLGGYCTPNGSNPEVFIGVNTKDNRFLEYAIHESLHACLPQLSEKDVEESAKDIAKFLKRLGFKIGK